MRHFTFKNKLNNCFLNTYMGFEQLNKMKIICLLNVPNLDFFLLPKASEFKKSKNVHVAHR